MSPTYGFRPLTEADLPMLLGWFAQPHVREWWPEDPEIEAEIRHGLSAPYMRYFLLTADGEPFAFLQVYDIWLEPETEPGDEWAGAYLDLGPRGTVGIDQFIGPADMVGRGHGSAAIRGLVDHLLAQGAPRVVTDPSPDNPRAIRAYEKAGFRAVETRDTPDGPALIMVREG